MAGKLTPQDIENIRARQNYLLIFGYDWLVGTEIVLDLDLSPSLRRLVARYNPMLDVMGFRAVNVVIEVDGNAVIPVMPRGDLLSNDAEFPHARFAAISVACERVAQVLANPDGVSDGYFASDQQGTLTIDETLASAMVTFEKIREILPAVAADAGEVEIIVPYAMGGHRPISLPKTEDVRKPDVSISPPQRQREFDAIVSGIVADQGFLVFDDGTWASLKGLDPMAFTIGKRYHFTEVGARAKFQKVLMQVTSDLKGVGSEQEEFPFAPSPSVQDSGDSITCTAPNQTNAAAGP